MPETLTTSEPSRPRVAIYDPEQETPAIDHVYHLTSSDRIDFEHPVLNPNPNRGRWEDWRKLEELIDGQRPDYIKELGISRRTAVFAYPTIYPINDPHSLGARPDPDRENAAHRIAVELEVDPYKVLVCNAGLLSQRVAGQAHLGSEHLARAERMAQQYWDSAVTLADFRKLYDTAFSGGHEAILKKGAPQEAGLPRHYLEPEVLVPGPIAEEHVRVAASGLRRQVVVSQI